MRLLPCSLVVRPPLYIKYYLMCIPEAIFSKSFLIIFILDMTTFIYANPMVKGHIA